MLKSRVYVFNEVIVAMVFGIILGPHVSKWVLPREVDVHVFPVITEVARIVIVIQGML